MTTAPRSTRMLRVQPEMKLEQLLRKLCEIFGEKETVRRSGRYSLGLIVELGFLERTGKAGLYRPAPQDRRIPRDRLSVGVTCPLDF